MTNPEIDVVIEEMIRHAGGELNRAAEKQDGDPSYWAGYRRALSDLKIKVYESSEARESIQR